MKRFRFVAVLIFGIVAIEAHAATLEVRLVANPVSGGTDGVWNIMIQAKTDTNQAGTGSGGISGFQFDITSQGTDKIAPFPAGVGPLADKVKTTWDPVISSNFSTITPLRLDATPGLGYPTDTDSDLDALGGSFADANNFKKTNLGVGGYVTIATEEWRFGPPFYVVLDHLDVRIIGAQWYDFINGTSPAFRGNYDTVITHGVTLFAPEPTSFLLLGVGVPGLIHCRRHRAQAIPNRQSF